MRKRYRVVKTQGMTVPIVYEVHMTRYGLMWKYLCSFSSEHSAVMYAKEMDTAQDVPPPKEEVVWESAQ